MTVDWERQHTSISQCSFDPDSSQQKLVSIRPVNGSISAVDQQGETNKGMIIGIAVGVVVAVILISGGVATVFIIRCRKRKQKGSKGMVMGTDDEAERHRQGIAKAELDTDPNHAVQAIGLFETDPDAGVSKNLVDGELKYPASHVELMGGRMMAEMNGSGQLAAELSSYKGYSGPSHKIYNPPARQVELPATVPGKLPASPQPRIRIIRSGDRRVDITPDKSA